MNFVGTRSNLLRSHSGFKGVDRMTNEIHNPIKSLTFLLISELFDVIFNYSTHLMLVILPF